MNCLSSQERYESRNDISTHSPRLTLKGLMDSSQHNFSYLEQFQIKEICEYVNSKNVDSQSLHKF